MNEDVIISPLFSVLYIMVVVVFIVFGLTGDFKLGLSLGFFAVMSLIMYFRYLDSRAEGSERQETPLELSLFTLSRRSESQAYEDDNNNLARKGRFIGTIRTRLRFIGTVTVVVIIVLFIAVVLNLAYYRSYF